MFLPSRCPTPDGCYRTSPRQFSRHAENQPLNIDVTVDKPKAGGVRVDITQIELVGNSRFAASELLSTLGTIKGKAYDVSDLAEFPARVMAFYRQAGYPFVRAYLPPQDLSAGRLTIQVVEGRYGRISTQGDPALAEAAEKFLYPLEHGALIESGPLERVSLILNDQPGIRSTPVIRPGSERGEGDLLIQVEKDQAVER